MESSCTNLSLPRFASTRSRALAYRHDYECKLDPTAGFPVPLCAPLPLRKIGSRRYTGIRTRRRRIGL